MKKKVSALYKGVNSKVGEFLVNRLLPMAAVRSVGSIFFLDHVYPVALKYEEYTLPTGKFAHPHRGIATFSYIFSGSIAHYDSKGNHDTIDSGGAQWMKAGNGIIHDEKPFVKKGEHLFHSLQFWINLPGTNKKEDAEYKSLHPEQVPEIELPDCAGKLRILLGEFGSWSSPIETFNGEFIYHIKLNPNSQFSFLAKEDNEHAVFVPTKEIGVNGTNVGNSKMVLLDRKGEEIIFENHNVEPADVLLFGGLPYKEPIIAEGPFVMNSYAEIATAYRDFFKGSYGEINYVLDKV